MPHRANLFTSLIIPVVISAGRAELRLQNNVSSTTGILLLVTGAGPLWPHLQHSSICSDPTNNMGNERQCLTCLSERLDVRAVSAYHLWPLLAEQWLAHAQMSLSRLQLQLKLTRWCTKDMVPLRVCLLRANAGLSFTALVLALTHKTPPPSSLTHSDQT